MALNLNIFLNFIKNDKNFNIPEEDLEKDINDYNFKFVILNKYNILKKIYFKHLYINLNLIKKNKFKNYIDFKDIIYEYNENIKIFNNVIYNFNYYIFTLENIDNEINTVIPQTEIYPFKIINYFYDYEESKKKNFLKNKNTKNYEIKGLMCFLHFKKTKLKEETKLMVICDEEHKKDLYVVNILDIIKKKNFNLYIEINKLVNKYIIDEWVSYCEYCEKNYVTKKVENFMTNVNVGILCSLSINKENISKKDILEYLYYNDTIENNNLHLHLYFKLYQYGKQTNKFNVKKIKKSISENLQENNFIYISYNLTKLNKNNFNFSVGYLKLNDDQNVCFLNYKNINKYTIESSNSLENQYKYFIEKKHLSVDKNNKIVLSFNGLTVRIDLSELLYSNFLNKNKRYNYNKLYLYEENIYIPDILMKYKKDINKNIIYINLYNEYYIKKNNIIFKKKLNKFLEKLFNIDNNDINWLEFINSNKEINLKDINLDNFLEWFKKTYSLYSKKNYTDALFIKNFFTCTNLDVLFFKTFLIDIDKNNIINDKNNFLLLKNFLKFFNNNFLIEKNCIILKNNNIILNKEKDFNNLFFVEILKIIFFLS